MVIDAPIRAFVREVDRHDWQPVCTRGEELFIENCRRRNCLDIEIGSRRFVAKDVRRVLLVEIPKDGNNWKGISTHFYTPTDPRIYSMITNALFLRQPHISFTESHNPVELGRRRTIRENMLEQVRRAAVQGIHDIQKLGPISLADRRELQKSEGFSDNDI